MSCIWFMIVTPFGERIPSVPAHFLSWCPPVGVRPTATAGTRLWSSPPLEDASRQRKPLEGESRDHRARTHHLKMMLEVHRPPQPFPHWWDTQSAQSAWSKRSMYQCLRTTLKSSGVTELKEVWSYWKKTFSRKGRFCQNFLIRCAAV